MSSTKARIARRAMLPLALLLLAVFPLAAQPTTPAVKEGAAAPSSQGGGAVAKPDAAKEPAKPTIPQGSFDLVEWVVLVVDAHRPNANEAAAFQSTLPGFARGRRPSADSAAGAAAKDPSPVGVIRLLPRAGSALDEEPIDVLLQVPAGRFLGNWPQGKPKNNRQLWDRVALAPGKAPPVSVDAGHWFEALRQADERSAPLSSGRWSERFLLYDAEVAHPNVIRVRAGAAGPLSYRVANAGALALRDVQLYAPAEGGWRVAGVEEVPPSAKPSPAATRPADEAASQGGGEAGTGAPAADELKQVFADASPAAAAAVDAVVGAEAKAAGGPAPGAPAATQPVTQPVTQPSTQPAGASDEAAIPEDARRDVSVGGDAKPLPAGEAVAGWRERLTSAGLSTGDADVILATLRTQALDAEQLTVVYRMEPAELDRLLPLEVVPAPAKVTRVGLVVVKNVDPAAGERIAKLIEQLASDDWDAREAAHAKLARLGAGARPKLTEALKHKDVEVVYRAERLLEALNPAPAAAPQGR